jgi:hypothetical protein
VRGDGVVLVVMTRGMLTSWQVSEITVGQPSPGRRSSHLTHKHVHLTNTMRFLLLDHYPFRNKLADLQLEGAKRDVTKVHRC